VVSGGLNLARLAHKSVSDLIWVTQPIVYPTQI